mgnify:CR=1 FL=1
MKKVVRFIAQCIDSDSGDIIEEAIMNEESLSKAETLKMLGYTHIEQIDFLQKIQDFKIKHQMEAFLILTYATNLYTMSSTLFQSLCHDSLRSAALICKTL